MADLIIPAILQVWLAFLLIFALLGYPVSFSILFGAIGGLAGGFAIGWWQFKGGVPISPPGRPADDKIVILPSPSRRSRRQQRRWEVPLFKRNRARQRYLDRIQKTQDRRMR